MTRRIISLVLSFGLLFQQTGFAQAGAQVNLSHFFNKPVAAPLIDVVRLPHLRYLAYDDAANTFQLLLEKGYAHNGVKPDIDSEGKDAFKYFLIGINLPNDTFWVNLRPDSEKEIIDNRLARTDVGRIMLEADLQLKKDTASFTSPQTTQGKLYWDRLYKKAEEIYGSESLQIPTLTRPWIVPGEVIVHYTKDSAYVYKATLKVMLEQDYLKGSAQYNFNDPRAKELNEYSSQLIRELIIPQLTREVNTSQRYAKLRQVYYSLILAQWFKGQFNKGKGTYASRIDKGDLRGLASQQSWSPKTYFDAYQKSFKDGEYKLEVPVYTLNGKTIRTYFSGGGNLDLSKILVQEMGFWPGQGSLARSVINAAEQRGIAIPIIIDENGSFSRNEPEEMIDLNRLERFINAKSSPVNVISQEVKTFCEELYKLGLIISLDGFEGLGDFVPAPEREFNISDLIKNGITRSVTTNNSIMFNIIGNMDKTVLRPEEFQNQFLGGRDINLKERTGLKITPLAGAILETINQDSRLLEDRERLFIEVYNKINEEKIAARIGAYLEFVWLATEHRHGYISVEPFTKIVKEGTVEEIVEEAKAKFKRVQDEIEKITGTRPRNILIKLPVTDNGLKAAEILLSEGYSVNYTLIATTEQYRAVIKTFKAGIRKFVENKWNEIFLNGDKSKSESERIIEFKRVVKEFIAQSVASIFVSRDDRNVYPIINDPTFAEMIKHLELRLKHEMGQQTNQHRIRETKREILFYKAMASLSEEDIKLFNENSTMEVNYTKEEIAELKHKILADFENLKVKDENGQDIVNVTKAGVAYTKKKIYPIFQEEFEKDPDWVNFIAKYQLPKELMSQQIYLASTGVKINNKYTTNSYYLENLVGPNITNTIPYPVIYEMVKQGKSLFEPKIQITENLDEALNTLLILSDLGIDLNLIKEEIIFKEGLDTFDKDDNKSLKIIGDALPVALEIKQMLDGSKSSPIIFGTETVDTSAKSTKPLNTGGIDFRYISLVTQAQMKEVIDNFKLPPLNVLKDVDIRSEAGQIKKMIAGGIVPSNERVIKYVAASYVKDEGPAQIQEAAACLADLFRLQEDNLIETSPELRAFLIVMDTKK